MAKSAFERMEGYDSDDALTILQSKLDEFEASHYKITGNQHSGYSAHAKTGQPLTIEAMKTIEIQAMVDAGMPLDYVTNAVNQAIQQLQELTEPIRIPWSGK